MLKPEVDDVVELRELLADVIVLISSGEVREFQLREIVDTAFEHLVNVFDDSRFDGFAELFEFAYANWSKSDGHNCLFAIEKIIRCCSDIFSRPDQENNIDAVEQALIGVEWLMPYSDEELATLLIDIDRDLSLLRQYRQENPSLFKSPQKSNRENRKSKPVDGPVMNDEQADISDRPATVDTDIPVSSQPISVEDLFLALKLEAENLDKARSIQVEESQFTKSQDEILSVFVEELEDVCGEFQANISRVGEIRGVLEQNISIVQNMLDATEVIQYEALSELILIIYQTIEHSNMVDSELTGENIVIWPFVLKELLATGITNSSINIVNLFIQRNVPDFEVQQVHDLCLRLGHFDVEAFNSNVEDRPRLAEMHALSLAIPKDSNRVLLESFLNELPDQAAELTKSLGRFIDADSVDDLNIARRITHNIKGSGNTMGVVGIANMTHHLEDILDRLAIEKAKPSPALAEVLQDAIDHLETMAEILIEGGELPESTIQAYQNVLDWANALDNDDVEIGQLLKVEGIDHLGQKSSEQLPSTVADEAESDKKGPAQTMRIAQTIIDNLVRVASENMISSGRIQEHALNTKNSLQELHKQQSQLNNIVLELEQLVFVSGVNSDRVVREGEFDPLEMEQYNELHTAIQRLLESANDSLAMTDSSIEQAVQLESVVLNQLELQKENQDQVHKMRMSPVSSIEGRFSRAVRQACRLTGKQVNFQLSGAETQVDSSILLQLVDPIMHILRNAIDHGIETAEDRIAANKSETGNVTLEFERVADQIIVRCHDDGAGFDLEKILAKAQQQELIPKSQKSLTHEEAAKVVLIPGFSTKENLTQVSGRGIGMDVVNQKIQEVKGNLKITSNANLGTDIVVSLPVSLMYTHALLINYEGRTVAISNRGIQDVIYLSEDSIKEVGRRATVQWSTEVLDVYSLAERLSISLSDELVNKIAIIVQLPDGIVQAVTVPFIEDSRDLVLKKLSKYLPPVNGLIGASILGDGTVTPVIDLTELDINDGSNRISTEIKPPASRASATKTRLPRVLVVDDSLSARRSMVSFVEDLGYQIVQANDGMAAQELINDENNNIVLVITDLEMPRMNGVDLTRQIKLHPRMSQTPVVMVTSRSTKKHVDLALNAGVSEYIVKPFDEDALAETINGLVHQ